MHILETTAWRRSVVALTIGFSAAALGACGGSDSDDTATKAGGASAPAASNESDSGRVRLTQCLRDQGIDVPDDVGEGGAPPADLDEDALAEALAGPCAEFRGGAFADSSASDQQELQDQFQKYAQCMRKEGIDFPDIDLGAGPPTALHELDQNDPGYKAADAKCADSRPQNPGGH